MLLLDIFQESVKVRSTKVIDRFQVGEHTATTITAEVFLANILKGKMVRL